MGKVKTIQKNTVVREKPVAIAYMLNKARQEVNKNGYDIFGGAKSVLVRRCPECGKTSLVGCISNNKEFIIAFCFNRYNKSKTAKCGYTKKWPNPKVEEDKVNIPETTQNNV